MSRTDKDMPYAVLARQDGTVTHDHTDGRCVIGSWGDRSEGWAARRVHNLICPRFVYIIPCVHNNERAHYQSKVDHARAQSKAFYVIVPDAATFTSNHHYMHQAAKSRAESSIAIGEMIDAGYFPNCDEAKTHNVDIREVDLRLIPGEKVLDTRYSFRGGYPAYHSLDITRPRFDSSITCNDEVHNTVTCYLERRDFKRRYYCCSRCDERQDRYSSRNITRDQLTNAVKEYNSFGYVED